MLDVVTEESGGVAWEAFGDPEVFIWGLAGTDPEINQEQYT